MFAVRYEYVKASWKYLLHTVIVVLCFLLVTNACAKESPHPIIIKAIRAQTLGDYDEAIRLLTPLSEQGAPEVLYRLGWLMTQDGNGENVARGMAMIERAAAMKYFPAMTGLAAIYGDEPASGRTRNMPVDHIKWKALMEEASSLGYWRASKELSDAYRAGRHQLTKDVKESCRFAALAEQQDFDAESTPNKVGGLAEYYGQTYQIRSLLANLSDCYQTGNAGKIDLTRAFAYLLLSKYDTAQLGKLKLDEEEAGLAFAQKWLKQHPQWSVPIRLRHDIPDDPHVLAKRLAAASPLIAAVKAANIATYTEKEAETIALTLMCEIATWNPSHPLWKPIYEQVLQDVLKAKRQFIHQFEEDEKMRDDITPYLEKAFTVDELRILVVAYEGKNGKILERAITMMMDILSEGALRMAQMRAADPLNADSALRQYAINIETKSNALPRTRRQVLSDAMRSMNLLADVMGTIPRGLGMSLMGKIGLALSGREQEWIEFCALDGGMNVLNHSMALKEQEAIAKWVSASGKNRVAMEAYRQEWQAIRARANESLSQLYKRNHPTR